MKNLLILLSVFILLTGCMPQTPTEKLVDVVVQNINEHPSKWSKSDGMQMSSLTYEVIENTDCNIRVSITSVRDISSMSIYSHEHGITVNTDELDDINKIAEAFNNRPKKEVQTPPDNTLKNADILISEFKNCYQ